MTAVMAWEWFLFGVAQSLGANSKKEWAFLAIALAGVFLSVILSAFSHKLMHKLEQILTDFEKNGATEFSMLEEERESKLASRLQAILHRSELEKLQSLSERDAVSALLSDLSHQLKTPLANLMMYTELLEAGGLSEKEQAAFLHEMRGQAEKMQWILKSMLKSSQLEQGIVSFTSGFTKIKETIASAVGSVYAKACEKHICVVTEEFEDCRLYHNPKWTAEALGNILDNAVKYSPRDSQVTVRLCMLETYARIEVEDEGIGIGKAESNQIFKRFYRGEQAGQQEGNGLGLYLAQLILSKEKGYVTVKSQKGVGSCFQVYLLKEPGAE